MQSIVIGDEHYTYLLNKYRYLIIIFNLIGFILFESIIDVKFVASNSLQEFFFSVTLELE